MSETMKQAEEKREPFVAELDENLPFKYDAQASILTSTALGAAINEYFRAVFADYEGCKIMSGPKGLSLSLCFKHIPAERRDPELHYGVELSTARKTSNQTLDRIRTRDFAVQYGDRYSLTNDGEDIIKPLLLRTCFSPNGKVNWGSIISETAEPVYGNSMYGMRSEQFTLINGIDINAVCSVLYGKKDAEGNAVVYEVSLRGALNGGIPGMNNAANQILILWINRINCDKLQETYAALGLGSVSSIIR